ncbi:polysaccharide deacetylase family protein [Pseudonocardia sp.]|uniref:polysaccharide deacetylase family protein n=1 Tax=Pseudonocardia sp. TaxID=60912 RepID=UPI0026234074|nr:polysaccharide deacetylase family protein [Pseudonocardia sp.]
MNALRLLRRGAGRLLPAPLMRGIHEVRNRGRAVGRAGGRAGKLRVALLGGQSLVRPELERPGAGSAVQVRVSDLDDATVALRPRSRDLKAFELVFDEGLHLPPPEIDGPLARIAVFGANIGLPLADLAVRYPSARLLGVEPDPDNATLARRNVADLGDRATIVETAVWHCDAELAVTWTQDAWGLDLAEVGPGGADDAETITAVDAGRLLREFTGGPPVDYLLVNIESAWYELLRHGDWTRDVTCIKIEIQDHYDEAVPMLERLGFRARLEHLGWGAFAVGVRPDVEPRPTGRVTSYVERARHSSRWRRDAARDRAAQARAFGERTVIARTGRRTAPTSRILCYHTVGMPSMGVNDVSLRRLERQLEQALDAGYRFVPAAELAADPLPSPGEDLRLALTFDDGFRSILTTVEPLLRGLGIPWTAFVVSGFAEGRKGHDDFLDWREISGLAERGVTIASHSVTHPNFRLLSGGQIVDELEQSRAALRTNLGLDTPEFAIPFGQSGNWTPAAHAAAEEAGYRTVYAQSVERSPDGTVPRTFVTKFDDDRIFRAALAGAFDRWEEWF